jgi:hypothetical protein
VLRILLIVAVGLGACGGGDLPQGKVKGERACERLERQVQRWEDVYVQRNADGTCEVVGQPG